MSRNLSLHDRFFEKVEKTESCWIWKGARDRKGYGRFWFSGRNAHAIRVAWSIIVGDLDPDLVLDHRCRVHRCVNPAHLDPVPREVNSARAIATRERDGRGRFEAEAPEEFWES